MTDTAGCSEADSSASSFRPGSAFSKNRSKEIACNADAKGVDFRLFKRRKTRAPRFRAGRVIPIRLQAERQLRLANLVLKLLVEVASRIVPKPKGN